MEELKMEPQDPSVKSELEDTTTEDTPALTPQQPPTDDPITSLKHTLDPTEETAAAASPPTESKEPPKKKTKTNKPFQVACLHCFRPSHQWSFCIYKCKHCGSKSHCATPADPPVEDATPCPNLSKQSPSYYAKNGGRSRRRQQEILAQAGLPTSMLNVQGEVSLPSQEDNVQITTLKREKEALFLAKDAAYQMLALKDAKIREKDREIEVLKLEKDALAMSRDAAQSLLAAKEAEVKNLRKFVAPGVEL
ncbi:hypothetical protein PRZ48_005637 [Zasmidium cellare]|uniref:Uncharacterized protein n=1 Tax=Zasmidium cellare TaxID=395010 RepID=A0ABR0EL50_ZASCE|nr:hypothetical protein PRZ48_005637 [Zasmidium cellare]